MRREENGSSRQRGLEEGGQSRQLLTVEAVNEPRCHHHRRHAATHPRDQQQDSDTGTTKRTLGAKLKDYVCHLKAGAKI